MQRANLMQLPMAVSNQTLNPTLHQGGSVHYLQRYPSEGVGLTNANGVITQHSMRPGCEARLKHI
eukprot:2723568-Alexandrium_andersonii.AAC.1